MNKRTAWMAALIAAFVASTALSSHAWAQAGGGAGSSPGASEGSSGNNAPDGSRAAPIPQSPGAPGATAPSTTRPSGAAGTTGSLNMSSLHEVDSKDKSSTFNGMTADALENMNIVNPNGNKIGEIDKALAGSDNKIVAVVADAGGILGVGGAKVVVPLDQLRLDSQNKRFVAQMDENQLKSMPKWQAPSRSSTGSSPAAPR